MRDSGRPVRLLLCLLLLTLPTLGLGAPAPALKSFDIPAGPADAALRQFAAQSGLELLFSTEAVEGIRTNRVKGDFAPLDALARLLRGTPLANVRDAKSGVLRIARDSGSNPPGAAAPGNGRPTETNPGPAESEAASSRERGNPAGGPVSRLPARSSSPGGALPALEPPVELTPFVVSATSDTGWVATETLAGTRLRTSFKDVPNQLETLTKDFMDDLALTGVQQALIYTANAENDNDYMIATPGNQASNPSKAGRIRGIGVATLSRNFFQVSNQTDNYNIERVTIASGPNAILFGLGSPAGILDATPARAQLRRNRYSFAVQYDSENSKRATFDANVVAARDVFALRLMGMSKREYTEKQPNVDRDDRLYGAVTFTPFKNTTVVFQVERDERKWNRAVRVAPIDFVTPWLNADKVPGSGYTTPRPLFDNSNLRNIQTNAIFAQSAQAVVYMQDGVLPAQNWRNSVTVRNPATLPGIDQTIDRALDVTLVDPAIFPFDVNVVGESRATGLGGMTRTLIVEQKLARNLYLELAYNAEAFHNNQYTAGGRIGSNNFRISVDPNLYLPDSRTPNPYAGQYYFQGSAGNAFTLTERKDWRATLSYERDLAQAWAPRSALGKWLGRHRLAGLHTEGWKETRDQLNVDRRILDEPSIPGLVLTPRSQENWATNATRLPQFRHYFANPYEPTRAFGPMTGEWILTDARGQPYQLYLLETGLRSADGRRLAAGQPTSALRSKVTSDILAWQGFFLPDAEKSERLVVTYGYRKDTARTSSADAASVSKDFSGLYPLLWDISYDPYGPRESGINRNVGVVARPLRWLSLFGNRSTTFDMNIGRYDPFGEPIPGAAGKGRDYGIRLDLWSERVTLRVNRFENTIGPQRASNDINIMAGNFAAIEQRVRELDPSVPTINVTEGNRRGLPSAGTSNYNITSDASSRGIEAELNFLPVRHWSIRLNGATSKATETNIGTAWFQWEAARRPVWQAVVARNGEVDAQGRPVTWLTAPLSASEPTGQTLAQYHTSQIVGRNLAFMAAANGRSTDTARGGRANLITNYAFAGEFLKGVNLGGALRWRAAPTIGYGTTTSVTGDTILDLDRAYKGKEELYLDGTIGYRGRMRAFGGFSYRLQLNVRNLLNENDPIPVTAFTTGAIAKMATVEPRTIIVRFEVTF